MLAYTYLHIYICLYISNRNMILYMLIFIYVYIVYMLYGLTTAVIQHQLIFSFSQKQLAKWRLKILSLMDMPIYLGRIIVILFM